MTMMTTMTTTMLLLLLVVMTGAAAAASADVSPMPSPSQPPCGLCPPGHHVSLPCSTKASEQQQQQLLLEDTSDVEARCTPCPPRHYTQFWNSLDRCLYCGSPCKEGQRLAKECSPTHDRVCECEPGTFLTLPQEFCERHSGCAAGHGVVTKGRRRRGKQGGRRLEKHLKLLLRVCARRPPRREEGRARLASCSRAPTCTHLAESVGHPSPSTHTAAFRGGLTAAPPSLPALSRATRGGAACRGGLHQHGLQQADVANRRAQRRRPRRPEAVRRQQATQEQERAVQVSHLRARTRRRTDVRGHAVSAGDGRRLALERRRSRAERRRRRLTIR
ncbi:uncharacterized protein LOC142921774 [Petromyzon marinus]|uniref:uncharacterized protein LOC142913453 n=1 Tax=Petromyzon marinus TaxID=7757 RepID=UPI003F6F1B1F